MIRWGKSTIHSLSGLALATHILNLIDSHEVYILHSSRNPNLQMGTASTVRARREEGQGSGAVEEALAQ